jgi:hypothetical protein
MGEFPNLPFEKISFLFSVKSFSISNAAFSASAFDNGRRRQMKEEEEEEACLKENVNFIYFPFFSAKRFSKQLD